MSLVALAHLCSLGTGLSLDSNASMCFRGVFSAPSGCIAAHFIHFCSFLIPCVLFSYGVLGRGCICCIPSFSRLHPSHRLVHLPGMLPRCTLTIHLSVVHPDGCMAQLARWTRHGSLPATPGWLQCPPFPGPPNRFLPVSPSTFPPNRAQRGAFPPLPLPGFPPGFDWRFVFQLKGNASPFRLGSCHGVAIQASRPTVWFKRA